MSEPQQPPVPPSEQVSPALPPAPPAAAPQQHPAAQPAQPAQPVAAHPAPQSYPAQHQPQAVPQPPYPPTMQQSPGQQPYPSYARDRAGGGNSLGRVAFIVAAITLAVELLSILMWPILYRTGEMEVADVLNTAVRLLTFAGFAAALVLGIVALRRERANLLAGIAVGIAGAAVLGIVFGWISGLFYSFI